MPRIIKITDDKLFCQYLPVCPILIPLNMFVQRKDQHMAEVLLLPQNSVKELQHERELAKQINLQSIWGSYVCYGRSEHGAKRSDIK